MSTKAPQKIWMQGAPDFEEMSEYTTWCTAQINEDDQLYIRADETNRGYWKGFRAGWKTHKAISDFVNWMSNSFKTTIAEILNFEIDRNKNDNQTS